MNHTEELARERRLDWALGELEGRERPPDLAARVVGRALAGDLPIADEGSGDAPARRWVAAAALLLGLLATLYVLLRTPSEREDRAQPATRRSEPTFALVANRKELAALPVGTRAIQGSNLGADALDELARFPDLEHLALHYGGQTRPADGIYSIRLTPLNLTSIGDEDLAKLLACRSLVSLDLTGAWNVRGDGLRHVAALPRLEELRLGYADTSDDGLAYLVASHTLREIRIVSNHALGTAGVRAIASIPSLQHLHVTRCPQLHETALVEISKARRLANLTLANLGGFRNEVEMEFVGVDRVRQDRVKEAATAPGVGVTDRVLEELAKLPALVALDVANGRYTRKGVRALARTRLVVLSLSGTPDLDADSVAALRATRLVSLDLGYCPLLGDDVAVALRGFDDLQHLELAHLQRLTDAGLAAIVANVPLRRGLGVSECRTLTEASARLLAATTHIRELDVRGCAGWTRELIDEVSRSGRKVKFFTW